MEKNLGILPAIEIETGDSPRYSVIWLHGLGADGNDFVPIIKQLNLPSEKSIRFVFPHAPERPITINNGYIMRAWYDIIDSSFDGATDESGIFNSQKAIEVLIAQEIQRGIAAEKIILAGFSQGGVMALQVGLRYTKTLAGILALSCYLPLAKTLESEANRNSLAMPIFMAHGIGDEIIPISYAEKSLAIIREVGFMPEWHEYPMTHSISPQEIFDISQWMQRNLDW